MDVERLLWGLADKYAPAARVPHRRPKWFDHAGDLVVTDGRVMWETPWVTEGGFTHAFPAGTYPVYAGTSVSNPDDRNRDGIRHVVSMIVIPLAEPARIAEAKWGDDGYDDIHLIEQYAILWARGAVHAALMAHDDVPSFFPDARDRITAAGAHRRRGNWVEVVMDRETGVNAFVFLVDAENVGGFEITDEEGNLLCLVLTAYS
ncbi:hypothetical protein FHS29_000907 [Saccharothrix tamanrassetensis]|uniref:Uncharacterized protein n=1 Tax=Saccharothrix tamanrassetensis TaxID=1051531 RepID=A0A841CDV2_9PSEU|nr:hypothetical protein [Saccharothrix tamanrassetensis]MBB5954337.1 hypothetical protein [Saccharothrix tamanrassetensis]